MATSTNARSSGRVAGLDLIRGIAIALVIVRHAWPEAIGSGGIVGVVAFFALSGYLITGLLTRDIDLFGHVRYGRFYRNRILRLFPPLLALLVAVASISLVWDPLGDRSGIGRMLLTGITYTGDLPFDHGSPAIGHLWTLATEEQFYIVWPILLTVALRWKRTGLVVAAAAAAVLLGLTATIWVAQPDVARIYPLPSSWAIAMVIGASGRLWERQLRKFVPHSRRPRTIVAAAAVVALLGIALVPEGKGSPASYFILGPSVAVITLVLIYAWSDWVTLPTPWLRPLLALGTISYAAYLWNYPIVTWIGTRPLPWYSAVGSIVLTIVAATVSWWLIEKPVQHWRSKLDRGVFELASTGVR